MNVLAFPVQEVHVLMILEHTIAAVLSGRLVEAVVEVSTIIISI